MRADAEMLVAIAAAYGYLSPAKLRRPVIEFLSDVDQQCYFLCHKCASKDPRRVLSWPAFRNQSPRHEHDGPGAQLPAPTSGPAVVERATAGMRVRRHRKPAKSNLSYEALSAKCNEEQLSIRESGVKSVFFDVSSNASHKGIAFQVFFIFLHLAKQLRLRVFWAVPIWPE